MKKRADELLGLARAGDVDACITWFHGMPEADRRALAIVRAGCRDDGSPPIADGIDSTIALCTGSLAELKRWPAQYLPPPDQSYRILVDRDPAWLAEWADHLVRGRPYLDTRNWPLVRRLVREGRIQRPSSPRYVLAMIGGLGTPLVEQLRADPGLLEHEVWQLFVNDGIGDCSLANEDRWGAGNWAGAFVELARDGDLDRQRLLDASLSALHRDLNRSRARWFTRLFDALEPDAEELRVRADVLLGLLRVSAAPVVSWTFAKVEPLARTGVYEPGPLILALEPVLQARAKGIVKKALTLLAWLARDASVRPLVARPAVAALGHDDPTVQERTLDLLEAIAAPSDAELIDQLAPYRELVAPTLRARLDAWMGVRPGGAESQEHLDPDSLPAGLRELFAVDELMEPPDPNAWALPAARFDGTDLPRLSNREPLQPVGSLDELLDLCAQGLEDTLGPDDVERALDGMARLGTERPEDFDRRVGPVAKRAHTVLERLTPFVGDGPPADLAGILVAWLAGDPPTLTVEPRGSHERARVKLAGTEHEQYAGRVNKTIGFLSRRALAVARMVGAGVSRPLLALPTHRGGFVDPRVLVERVTAWTGSDPPAHEVALAMLRLAPEHRVEALAGLPAAGPEWIRAIRHALGGSEEIGTTTGLWVSAARARAPWEHDSAVHRSFPDAGPDAGEYASYARFSPWARTPPLPAASQHLDPDCPPQLFHAERGHHMWELGGIGGGTENSIRWVATLWPGARESLFAASAAAIAQNLDWWEARWYAKALLEPLLEPGTPLRDMGLLLLALGLGAKEPGEHLLAVDAAIAAIEDGRLGGDNLGRVLGEILVQPQVKLGRYATTLATVADVSDAHAAVVFVALDAAVPRTVRKAPRDLGRLLELLEQLCARLDAGVSESARSALARLKGSSKAAKAARRIRERPAAVSHPMVTATRRIAAMRIAAASRWMLL